MMLYSYGFHVVASMGESMQWKIFLNSELSDQDCMHKASLIREAVFTTRGGIAISMHHRDKT